MFARVRSLARHWPGVIAVAAALLVYFPLTRTYFWSDDFSNFTTIENRGFLYLVTSEPGGGHCSFFGDIFYYLPYLLFGFRPEPYGWLALALHGFNVAWLYRVGLRLVMSSPPLAGVIALSWGVCSLQSETLGWFCVNQHALVATAVFLILDRIADRRGREVSGAEAATWAFILWCGATSFRDGAAIALVFPFVLPLLAPRAYRRLAPRIVMTGLPVIVFLTYYGARLYFEWYFESISVVSRMVPALAFFYVMPVIEMTAHMVAVSALALVQGPAFSPNQDPIYGPATIAILATLSAVAIAGFALGGVASRRRLGAFAAFALVVYGSIALGRANFYYLLLRTPPEISAKLPRYHYVGSALLALILLEAVKTLVRRVRLGVRTEAVVFAITTIGLAASNSARSWKLDEHGGCRQSVTDAMREIDGLVDAAPRGSTVTLEDRELACLTRDVTAAGLFSVTHESNVLRGRTLRFRWDEVKFPRFSDPKNRRLSKLLVSERAQALESRQPRNSDDTERTCSKLQAEMEKVRLALGCFRSDWPLWRALCRTTSEQTECLPPLSKTAACLGAQPVSTWHCDTRGTLRWLLEQDSPCRSEWAALDACLR